MQCVFFNVCAAYIIEEKLGHIDYSCEFCKKNFKDCKYYKYRSTSEKYKEFVKKGWIGLKA